MDGWFCTDTSLILQKQRGEINDGITVRDYVNQIKTCLPDKSITVIVLGLEQYFK